MRTRTLERAALGPSVAGLVVVMGLVAFVVVACGSSKDRGFVGGADLDAAGGLGGPSISTMPTCVDGRICVG